MQVKAAAVHRLNKQKDMSDAVLIPGQALLANTDALRDLLVDILRTYNNKTAQRTGVFDTNTQTYPFSQRLSEYRNGSIDFLTFTHLATEHLHGVIKTKLWATGGYFFFVHYEEKGVEFVLVVKLTQTQGQVFNEKMTEVTNANHLSTDRIQQAGRINLRDLDKEHHRYLTFVSAKEGGRASEYFVGFLGCSDATKPKVETNRLVTALNKFCESRKLDLAASSQLKRRAYDHARDCSMAKPPRQISLQALSNMILPDEPQAFIEYINSVEEDVRPTDDFIVDKSALKKLVGYSYKDENLNIWMSTQFKINHKVRIEKDKLVIDNPPSRLRDELEGS
jgi:nucleoid-associated protein